MRITCTDCGKIIDLSKRTSTTKKVVKYFRIGLSYSEICKLLDFKTKADVTYHLTIAGEL